MLEQEENSAWAEVHLPLPPAELRAFCQEDPERLLRINPYLEFTRWLAVGDGEYIFSGRNHSQEEPFDFDLRVRAAPLADGLRLQYVGGLKCATQLTIEPSPHGSKLTIRETYRDIDTEAGEDQLATVDRSLTTWAGDLQKYLVLWKQWRWLPPWRFYMRRVWQPMKPMGRRIAYIFWWITLVEFALIMLGAGIYWVEYA